MKLFKVKIRGGYSETSTNYQESFVVAKDPTSAYKKVRNFLDKNELCFATDRELLSVTLLADTEHYGDCQTILFL